MGGGRDAGAVAGQPVVIMSGVSVCVPTGTPMLPVSAQTRCWQRDETIEHINVNFPFQFDGRGRTDEPRTTIVRQLVEQVLFTSPGERVNLPDFGSGLLQLPFAPNSIEMAAATQFTVQGALQKWLSSYIKVQSVVAAADEAMLTVTVTYTPLNTDVTQVQTFVYGGPLMIYSCCNENRKAAVLGNPTLNGIDYLEVLDHEASGGQPAAADAAGDLPEPAAREPAPATC